MSVYADFECGNIEYVRTTQDGDAIVRLRTDPVLPFRQWFYFAVERGGRDIKRVVIENAAEANVPMGWPDLAAFRSRDNVEWSRTPTHYIDGKLILEHEPSSPHTYYAYFPPYLRADHKRLLEFCRSDDRASVEILGSVTSDDELELIQLGNQEPGALRIWIIARQHPGEVPASWWIEGFVRKLLDPQDADSLELLRRARLHIVPNMNPDGSRLGNYRTNSFGRNLNASWDAPSATESAAVSFVLERMKETGIDFALDIHADEELSYVFVANVDRIVPPSPPIAAICDKYQLLLGQEDPFFKPRAGYVRPHTKSQPLSFYSPHIMHRFGAPAVTLELPHKRFAAGTDREREYGVAGCIATGRASLSALSKVLDDLFRLKAVPRAS